MKILERLGLAQPKSEFQLATQAAINDPNPRNGLRFLRAWQNQFDLDCEEPANAKVTAIVAQNRQDSHLPRPEPLVA